MELTQLKELLKEPVKLIEKVKSQYNHDEEGQQQYQPENHKVNNPLVREDRKLLLPNKYGILDEKGEPKLMLETQPVARITSAAQKQIVSWACQIAAGVPIEISAEPKDETEKRMLEMLKRTLSDNKMQYADQEILRLRSIYKICAEVWFSEPCSKDFWNNVEGVNSKFKMKLMILSEETGDFLYPVKDSFGKIIALGRAYKGFNDLDKEINLFDLFTDKQIITYSEDPTWEILRIRKIAYGKANFIVHSQPRREWEDVQVKIERLESLDSNAADNNDALGSPMLAITGEITGFGKRGETGKVFELKDGGDIKVIEAAGAPEAIKDERENLLKGIFTETNTPHISFDDAKGFGANVPGITLKLLFLPATLKAMSKQSGGWGMSVQRRFNFLLYALAQINVQVAAAKEMELAPRFSIYMPSNDSETYENIRGLVKDGLLSKKRAVEMLGLVKDFDEEIAQIDSEQKSNLKTA
jgi:SPP1 family phage portal protein